jgi:hypothetical protein
MLTMLLLAVIEQTLFLLSLEVGMHNVHFVQYAALDSCSFYARFPAQAVQAESHHPMGRILSSF